eukprot:1971977-Rhodomonas_salina.2
MSGARHARSGGHVTGAKHTTADRWIEMDRDGQRWIEMDRAGQRARCHTAASRRSGRHSGVCASGPRSRARTGTCTVRGSIQALSKALRRASVDTDTSNTDSAQAVLET